MVTSETAIKYMEEDIVSTETEIKTIISQIDKTNQNSVEIEQVLQYARYLLKHLAELILNISNPLRRAAFFGIIFNTMPSFAVIDFETQEKSPLPVVNGLFRVVLDYKSTSGGITEGGVEQASVRRTQSDKSTPIGVKTLTSKARARPSRPGSAPSIKRLYLKTSGISVKS